MGKSKSKNKKNKSIKKSSSNINNNDNHSIAYFRINENKDLSVGQYMLQIKNNDIILAPYTFNVNKTLYKTINDVHYDKITPSTDLTNSSILIYRYGGIGDLLNTLFVVEALKNKFKNIQIGYICSPSYFSLFNYFTDIVSGVLGVFSSYQTIMDKQYFIDLTDLAEENQLATSCSLPFLFGYQFGLTDNEISTAISRLIAKISSKTNCPERNGIGIQLSTNAPVRNYNLEHFSKLINMIKEKYPHEKVLLLSGSQNSISRDYVISNCNYSIDVLKTTDLSKIIFSIARLKMIIGPDSSMLHIAGITNTPMIGLYGPFPSKLRISNYNNAIGIDGKSDCSPCFRHHPTQWCKYNGNECIALNSIPPSTILDVVDRIMDIY